MSAVYEHSHLDSDANLSAMMDAPTKLLLTASSLVLVHVADHHKIMLSVCFSIFGLCK